MDEPFDLARPEPARLRAVTRHTQAELAALIGSARYQTWQAWERGERAMPSGMWTLALLLTDRHPTLRAVERQPG